MTLLGAHLKGASQRAHLKFTWIISSVMMRPSRMQLGPSESFLWYVTVSLEIILAVLVLRRRGFRSFPFFTSFVLLSTLRTFLLWVVYRWIGFRSLPTSYVAWSTQGLLLITRAAICAELCWRVLRKRPKLFWTLARDVLVAIGAGVSVYTGFDSVRKIFHLHRPSSALAVERGIELAIAVVLISLLLLAFRYKIQVQRGPFLIATGLCFYSLVQTLNNTFLDWLSGNFSWWNDFRIVAFQVALLLWIWAFASRDFDSDDQPVPVVPRLYAQHAEEVSRKLRSLDGDLEEIVRK
jgi:hypothetical protein